MNDHPHPIKELGPGQAQRLQGGPDHKAEEKAFRRAVARRFYAYGQGTQQIAEEMKVDESTVYNVLDKIRRERIDA